MVFRCPYTDVCRAQAIREFADSPDLMIAFSQRLQCREQDATKAQRCATLLGLAEQEFPTLGYYVQSQRRNLQIPQRQLAQQAGIDLQQLRDLELNKLDPTYLPLSILEQLAKHLTAPIEYVKALAKMTAQAGTPRQGVVFARNALVDDTPTEPS